ncbi:MAG: hypothetical protein L6Q77_14265, partial [Bacteroidetes bacterium]|nr:hypothetical protein [Bacteroidota bacterium]
MKLLLPFLLLPATLLGQTKDQPLLNQQAASSEVYSSLENNQIRVWFNTRGNVIVPGDYSYKGFEFPARSGLGVIYGTGIGISGYIEDELRTAWQASCERIEEWQPGNLIEAGPAPASNRFRIYKINRGDDWRTSEDIRKWPVDLGAPWIDRNGDGVYQPELGDYPDLTGDQMLWMVINDGVVPDKRLPGSKPMNLECRIKAFIYDRNDAFGTSVFVEYQLINKNPEPIKEFIFSVFMDSDNGSSEDDLVGCDTLRRMTYTYNENNQDGLYGAKPPAVGIGLLAGPALPSLVPGAKTWVNRRLQDHYKAGKIKAHIHYHHGAGNGRPFDFEEARQHQTGEFIFIRVRNPLNYGNGSTLNDNPLILFPGYPELSTGWRDSNGGDRRQLLSTEPFDMAPGDTQTILT